ncbi:MAG: hypothetical protein AAFX50_20085, partial [Acidobacteriota bacterium]
MVVTSDSSVSGDSKAAVTIDAESNFSSELALRLRAKSAPGAVDELMVVRGDGHVGIGTENPVTDLHVAGQGFFTKDLIIGNNAMIRGRKAMDLDLAQGGAFFNAAESSGGGANGINSSPGYQIYMMHNLDWDGSQWTQPRGAWPSQAFTVGHHYDMSWWRSDPTGLSGGTPTLVRSMTIDSGSGNLSIGGAANPASRLVVGYNSSWTGDSDWAVAIDSKTSDSTTGILGLRNSSNDDVFFARSDGHVGIGTRYPVVPLHVKGAVQVDGPLLLRDSNFTGSGTDPDLIQLLKVWGHRPARIEQSHSLDLATSPYFAPDIPTLDLLRGSATHGATLSIGNQTDRFYFYANHEALRFYAPDQVTAVQTLTASGN